MSKTVQRTEYEVVENQVEKAVCEWCGDEQPVESMNHASLNPDIQTEKYILYQKLGEIAARNPDNHDVIDAEVDQDVFLFSANTVRRERVQQSSVYYDYDPEDVELSGEEVLSFVERILFEKEFGERNMWLCDFCAPNVFEGK